MDIDELSKQIRTCENCSLAKSRKNAVPGEGDPKSNILFVGEAPGGTEDELGRPFVGAAGELLTKMIQEAGLDRSQVYITNVIKCRPPYNRDPLPDEIQSCASWLIHQLKIIEPKLIICLGRHSMDKFLPGVGRISQVHGRLFKKGNYFIIPFYHPAACLHQPSLLDEFINDFKKLPDVLEMID